MNSHTLFAKLQREQIKQVKNRAQVLIIYVNMQQNIQTFFFVYFWFLKFRARQRNTGQNLNVKLHAGEF